jgi:hypothetical protein
MFLKAIELMAMILTDTHLAEPITQWRAERGGGRWGNGTCQLFQDASNQREKLVFFKF